MTTRRTFCAVAAGVLAGCASAPSARSAAARAELGSTGKLRAAITAAQAWLSAYIEQMKARGFVGEALQRHRIQGAAVAPPS